MSQRRGLFARFLDLWRGIFGVRLADAEARNAEAVYLRALETRQAQLDKLAHAVGRLVFLRNRLLDQMQTKVRDRDLIDRSLQNAVHTSLEGDEAPALALIRKRREIEAELTRLQEEHARVAEQCETAKDSLVEAKAALVTLRQERDAMLARKAHALARIDVAEAIADARGDFTTSHRALDHVREAISALEVRAELGQEIERIDGHEVSLDELRREADADSDRRELARLKMRLARAGAVAASSGAGDAVAAVGVRS
jgi:phage shock protein A